jgi:2,4-dienoyl-CoA reductase-like NADH-dependent reductase (Old Yellow Enzyme family)
VIFEPITIGGVTFKNRILRSSIGGKTAYYSGIVSPAWKHFEKRFAEGGVGGIVSATLSVHEQRWAPIEYPKISNDATIGPLREAIAEIQELGVRYIIQIGDPGAHTQMSLFSEAVDGRSSSRHLDFLYGYRSVAEAMSTDEISAAIENFAQGARRVRDAGADGVEITASKGYLIHQFLNPGINRRRDGYGGSPDNRFRSCVRSWRRSAEPWAKISSSVYA